MVKNKNLVFAWTYDISAKCTMLNAMKYSLVCTTVYNCVQLCTTVYTIPEARAFRCHPWVGSRSTCHTLLLARYVYCCLQAESEVRPNKQLNSGMQTTPNYHFVYNFVHSACISATLQVSMQLLCSFYTWKKPFIVFCIVASEGRSLSVCVAHFRFVRFKQHAYSDWLPAAANSSAVVVAAAAASFSGLEGDSEKSE